MSDETDRPHPPITGQWKPGQSGNPKGRPKKKPVTAALERIFEKISDQEAETFAAALFAKAGSGDVAAFKEICDRIEGKVVQPVGGGEGLGPITLRWGRDSDDNSPGAIVTWKKPTPALTVIEST